jgi:hypothetical protein
METTKNLSQYSHSPSRYSNQASTAYKPRALPPDQPTDEVGENGNPSDLYSRGTLFQSRPGHYPNSDFCGFPQHIQAID